MKVVLAGGSGFVGRHVAAALIERGHGVLVVDRGTRMAPPGVERVAIDLTRGEVPAAVLADAGALVNLVGIKRADRGQGFRAAHVEVTRRLAAAARAAGVRRFVHVSVVCARPDPTQPYHDTKWRAEEVVRGSGLNAVILRPGVIYGSGDDMVTHLTRMIGLAPVFPIVGQGQTLLQPVDVRDVAEAVASALERPEATGQTYDVVGPERMTLRTVVETVAEGLGLPLAIVPTPAWLLRPVVAAWSAMTARALSTPAQLRMLEEGLVGDPQAARRDLGIAPRPFTAEAVRLLDTVRPRTLSVRVAPTREERLSLAGYGIGLGGAVGLAAAAWALVPLLGWLVPNVWLRLAVAGALLTPLALAQVRLPWRSLWRPRPAHLVSGAAVAAALYGAGALAVQGLALVPGAEAQIATLYAWKAAAPAGLLLPLLLGIVVYEEVVWRNAVTLPLAARLGPVRGVLAAAAAFAAAHVSLGVPILLVAALGAGAVWSALVVRTRSAVPALVSHLLWDVAVLLVWPYRA